MKKCLRCIFDFIILKNQNNIWRQTSIIFVVFLYMHKKHSFVLRSYNTHKTHDIYIDIDATRLLPEGCVNVLHDRFFSHHIRISFFLRVHIISSSTNDSLSEILTFFRDIVSNDK